MSDESPHRGADAPADDAVERALRERFGAALVDPAVWSEPDASLGESIVALIAAERAGTAEPTDPRAPTEVAERTDPAAPADTGNVAELTARRPASGSSVPRAGQGRRLWLAAAAAVAVAAGFGVLVTIGTFHMRGGDDAITLWSGVELADYPILTVTLQREGEGPASSGQVVLTGRLAD